jgi:hypothetical protein
VDKRVERRLGLLDVELLLVRQTRRGSRSGCGLPISLIGRIGRMTLKSAVNVRGWRYQSLETGTEARVVRRDWMVGTQVTVVELGWMVGTQVTVVELD